MGMAGVVGRSCSKLGQAAQFHMTHIIILIITFTESFSQDGVTESFSQDGVLFSLCCAWPYNCITKDTKYANNKGLKVLYVSVALH